MPGCHRDRVLRPHRRGVPHQRPADLTAGGRHFAMAAIDKSGPTVISGLKNAVLASAYRYTPKKILLAVSQQIMKANARRAGDVTPPAHREPGADRRRPGHRSDRTPAAGPDRQRAERHSSADPRCRVTTDPVPSGSTVIRSIDVNTLLRGHHEEGSRGVVLGHVLQCQVEDRPGDDAEHGVRAAACALHLPDSLHTDPTRRSCGGRSAEEPSWQLLTAPSSRSAPCRATTTRRARASWPAFTAASRRSFLSVGANALRSLSRMLSGRSSALSSLASQVPWLGM